MASIATEPNGRRRILFEGADRKRRTIRLGVVSMKDAQHALGHVENLITAAVLQASPPPRTVDWLNDVGDKFYARLVAAGLCSARVIAAPSLVAVGELIDAYFVRRTDLKASTQRTAKQVRARLVDFFGETRPAASINTAEAKDWRRHVRGLYAEATTAKSVKLARQIWADAVERGTISENPFMAAKIGTMDNPERNTFIERADIDKIIATTTDPQWRLLIALARYAGLRTPSEPLALTWADILWDEGKMRVRSPKMAHVPAKAVRWVPIFPEIREHLQRAFDEAEPGELNVITRFRDSSANLRTQFERLITRAGLTPWDRPFQALRASRETELADSFPLHVVCAWIGNDENTAKKHYLKVRDTHFDAAVGAVTPPGKKVALNPAQQMTATGGKARQTAPPAHEKSPEMPISSTNPSFSMTPMGFEPMSPP